MRRRGCEIPPDVRRTVLRRNVRRIVSLAAVLLLPAPGGAEIPAVSVADTVQVPEVWKMPPTAPHGTSWYRCRVTIPGSWRGREVRFFLEPVDDAREIVVNGMTVGAVGRFPPAYRSGLGGVDRHTIAPDAVRWGQDNVVAIRVHAAAGGRTGFNVAPPAILAGDEGIVLSGAWQVLPEDDAAWGRGDDRAAAEMTAAFATIRPAAEIEATLRRLPDEDGPLDVASSLERLTVPDDLVVEAVLAEPDIGQPLFLDFDERGRLWVMNYRQYPHPAGLTAVSRDAYLRTVYDHKPEPPPRHVPGRDRITFHEDTDGDGIYDRHGTFVEGLNIATAFARGRGGVFVLNPPHLLFYADRDGDDVPDGDPEVLLEGFGLEDTHSVASHLRWGPDGWLYGAQGSTVTGAIRRPGSDEEPRHSMGQLIWRYHPETRRYEVFAEGGGNAFGLEIDAKGRIFSGHNGGDTRGFHYVQGGYYRKGFGKHGELSNPHAFGFFEALEHAAVPRFTHTFVIAEGAALPSRLAGKLFAVAPLQSHVVASGIRPRGATFRTDDVGFLLESRDPWFRPVEIKLGPDGGIFVADFHEQRIDHASHHQGRVTPDTGRVYRVRAAAAPPPARFDYRGWSAERLVELLRHDNRWHRQIALRMLADRRDASVLPRLRSWLDEGAAQTALEALWAIHLVGGLDEPLAIHALLHADPHVRLWTVRLLADAGRVSATVAARLRLLATAEPEVEVRGQLAASARRLPADQALPIVAALCRYDTDRDDPLQPLLLWWAIEAHTGGDREAVLDLFADEAFWRLPLVREHLLERLMRRFAQAGGRHDLLACGRLLDAAPDAAAAATLLRGFEAAFAGRTVTALPDAVAAAVARAGGGSLGLRVRQGDAGAITAALEAVQDAGRPLDERIELAGILGQVRAPGSVPVLVQLFAAADPRLCIAALSAAEAHADPEIAAAIIAVHDRLPAAARPVAQAVLASRRDWREAWLEALEAGRLAPAGVAADVIERLSRAEEPGIADRVRGLWPAVAARDDGVSPAEVERLAGVIAAAEGSPAAGRAVFRAHCGTCHALFADGGRVGPDLTAYQRDDLRRLLRNVVDPSHEIRAGYEQFVALTVDGRSVNGFIADQDDRVVVLRAADGREIVLARDEIDQLEPLPRSIMPEKLLDPLDEKQIRDLFAYLRATQPLPP